nr:MAG TPA: hypothetical protein [Caudoviricetes sp.]
MINLNNTLTAITNKFKSIDAADTGIRTKVITKTLNVTKGINSLGSVGIEGDKIISISGAVQYANYMLPLSYPMLNYGSGGYIEWGLAAIVHSGNLELISGAEWNNCKVKVVISYIWG